MTEKSSLAALAVATVGLGLMLAGDVGAKPNHCRKDCKQDSKSCLALVPPNKDCTGTKAEKKACRKMHAAQRKTCRSLAKLCKQENPNMSGACLPGCGRFLTTWGSSGSGDGQFDGPFGVAVDGSGNVFVADTLNNRIEEFMSDGTFLFAFGWGVQDGMGAFEICASSRSVRCSAEALTSRPRSSEPATSDSEGCPSMAVQNDSSRSRSASRAAATSRSAHRRNGVPRAGNSGASPRAMAAQAAARSGTRMRHDTPSTLR